MSKHVITCQDELLEFAHLMTDTFEESGNISIEIKVNKKGRTITQNKALHKYFSLLSKALNDAGYDMKKTLKPEAEISWSEGMVKEYLWRPIQKAMLGKESTAKLETKEVSEVYSQLSRHLSQKLGISVPFPDRFGDQQYP